MFIRPGWKQPGRQRAKAPKEGMLKPLHCVNVAAAYGRHPKGSQQDDNLSEGVRQFVADPDE